MVEDAVRRCGALAAWGVGAALAARQFFARASLWVDELAIVRNLEDRTVDELLTQPLDYDQVAPAGFLLVQKILGELGGYAELSVRAWPFASALLTLALVARLALALIPGPAALLPPLLLGLSALQVAMAAQAKQYASDGAVMAALLLLAVTPPGARTGRRWRAGALALGIVGPWLSQTALFALPAAALALLLDERAHLRRPGRWTMATIAAWAASGLAALLASRARVAPGTLAYMRDYWRDGFPPAPTSWLALKWWPYSLRMLVADVSNGAASYLLVALAALGALVLWRRARRDAVVLLVPVLGVWAAAALRQYPMLDRLTFFLAPIVVTLIGVSAGAIAARLGGGAAATSATLALLLAPSVLELSRHLPPYAPQSVRPLLELMRRELRPGDRAYIPYASWQAWVHYAPRVGLASVPVHLGSCHGERLDAYRDEVTALDGGARTWTLFVPAGRIEDPAIVAQAADARAPRLLTRVEPGRDARGKPRDVTLYLHDAAPRGGEGIGAARFAPAPASVAGGRQLRPAPPPLPPRPSAASCRGAAVPRRLERGR